MILVVAVADVVAVIDAIELLCFSRINMAVSGKGKSQLRKDTSVNRMQFRRCT